MNHPTPRDVFTLICTTPAPNEHQPELVHVHDFDTCSAAIQNASAYARKHPSHTVEVWLNRSTILWQTNGAVSPPTEQWSGPAAVGTYAVTWPNDASIWTPIYKLLTSRSAA